MHVRARLLLGGLGAIVPAPARACGTCVDAGLLEWSWLTAGVPYATGILFVELIVYGVLNRFLRFPHRSRGRWMIFGLGLAFALAVSSRGSGLAVALGFGIGLAVRFGLSVREMLPVRPRLACSRVGAVVLLLALAVFSACPDARPTSWLVEQTDGALHRGSVPAHLIPTAWSVRELVRREDAPAALLARLARFEPDPSEYDRDRGRILRLLRAHTMAGGDATQRHAECRRLGVDPSWGEIMRSAHAARLCGPLADPIAAVGLP